MSPQPLIRRTFLFNMNQRTHEEFIKKLNEVHPNREWSVIGRYEHNMIPILLRDKYGDCLIKPNALIQKSRPSIKTAVDKTTYCINKFKDVWGEDMFDYSEFEYNGVKTPSTIICKAKGHKFSSHANNHLSKRGCPKCAKEAISERVRSNTEEFVAKAIKIHGDKYDYRLVNYVGAVKKVKIICPFHGEFEQTPNSHLNGSGCVKCSRDNSFKGNFHTVSKGRECTFYIIECHGEGEKFIKIGVTSTSIKERYNKKKSMPYKYSVLKEIKSYDSEAIHCLEWECLNITQINTYSPKEKFNGYTECRLLFTRDILLKYVNNINNIEEHKNFTIQMMGKDEAFNKRYKELIGVSLCKGMNNFNKHLRENLIS